MALYAIGDVHGCYEQLMALLQRIQFRPETDRLWFTGDIINRGPDSLNVLSFVRDLGDRAIAMMGNHEIRALAGIAGHPSKEYTRYMTFLHNHPQAQEIFDWLRKRPFWHRDVESGWSMTHAGLHPTWSLAETERRADDLAKAMADDDLLEMVVDDPSGKALFAYEPDPELGKVVRMRFDLNVFTRVRLVAADGEVLWPGAARNNKELPDPFAPPEAESAYQPWYALRDWQGFGRILYGHWAMAGLTVREQTVGLDSGCVYGGKLTAIRLDDPALPIQQLACPQFVEPGD